MALETRQIRVDLEYDNSVERPDAVGSDHNLRLFSLLPVAGFLTSVPSRVEVSESREAVADQDCPGIGLIRRHTQRRIAGFFRALPKCGRDVSGEFLQRQTQ